MAIFITGFSGDITDNGARIAGFSASYQSAYNPNNDYFIVNFFDTNGQQFWREIVVPKIGSFQREETFVLNTSKQLFKAINPLVSISIENYVINKFQSDDHAYITVDHKNSMLIAQLWQQMSNKYIQQNMVWKMTMQAVKLHLGL